MGKWLELIESYALKNPYIRCNPPAVEEDLDEVESKLGITIPGDLRELLMELNGDNNLIFSTAQIIETNLSVREAMSSAMPLDCLLFVAGNGCGDCYGYPITRDGIKDWEIFMWEHEYDNRVYKSNGLREAIQQYYNDEI